MPAFNIVVFGGDHCGPEVSCRSMPHGEAELIMSGQVTKEALKVTRLKKRIEDQELMNPRHRSCESSRRSARMYRSTSRSIF